MLSRCKEFIGQAYHKFRGRQPPVLNENKKEMWMNYVLCIEDENKKRQNREHSIRIRCDRHSYQIFTDEKNNCNADYLDDKTKFHANYFSI